MTILRRFLTQLSLLPNYIYSKYVYRIARNQDAFAANSPYLDAEFAAIRSRDFSKNLEISHKYSPDQIGIATTLARIVKKNSEPITICDFGGGDSRLYRWIESQFENLDFDYHFVEVPAYVDALTNSGTVNFTISDAVITCKQFPKISIHKIIPNIHFDLIIAGAVIGWVEEPFAILSQLSSKCDALLVLRTLSGKASSRNGFQRTKLKDRTLSLPCWFLNTEELIRHADKPLKFMWDSSSDSIFTSNGTYHFESFLFSNKF